MMPTGYFVDANLLTLLVAGNMDKKLIDKHKRLERYQAKDYFTLLKLLRQVKCIYVTPNTLTEASNLLGQHGEPERSLLLEHLKLLIQKSEEIIVASATASQNSQFKRLGLTDAALLEAIKPETPLLTVDLDLYKEGEKSNAAVNFNYYLYSN